MAEPIDPIPDAPPAEPRDVETFPDAPPAEPFDVPIFPDPAPAGTFDVSVAPDGPPIGPVDVPVYPDGPPITPFDVGVTPSGPPTEPVDVPVTPSHPPVGPFDVPVSPDSAPGVPFDVPITQDGPPTEPVDVQLTPDAPPGEPFDVAVTLDGPPVTPVDVLINPDFPIGADNLWIGPTAAPGDSANVQIPKDLFDPAKVSSNRDPGVPALPYPLPQKPTIEGLIEVVQDYDRQLANFLNSIIDIDVPTITAIGAGALDPTILAGWFRDYMTSVGPGGVAKFIAEQGILYAMNPVAARIFDPSYFIKMSLPGSPGNISTTLDTQVGETMRTAAEARDVILQERVFLSPDRPAGDGRVDRLDAYGPDNKYTEGQAYSVDSLVDAALEGNPHPHLRSEVRVGQTVARFDASSFFEERRPDGASLVRQTARLRAIGGAENVMNSKLAASNALDGIIPAGFPGEQTNGSVISPTQDPSTVVDDDDARLPISFTDLRQVPGEQFRSVYFRPENLQIAMAYAPEYGESNPFGRVDPVIGYQRTVRTINISFDVHAFSPEDLRLIHHKMHWLTSMVYPSYGTDSLVKSGPVTRIRVGDLVATSLGGVAGVIRNLNFDFNEAQWELARGNKVPMMYKVSMDFLCLHDGPVGTLNGTFGVFQLPPGGLSPDQNTNFGDGNPTDSREAPTVSVLPGRLSKFGEPRS